MTNSLPPYITLSPDVLFQELEDEAILLNITSENYYGLDDVGLRIWQLLEEHGGETELVISQMQAEYHVDEALLRDDITNLMAELSEAGLVTMGQ